MPARAVTTNVGGAGERGGQARTSGSSERRQEAPQDGGVPSGCPTVLEHGWPSQDFRVLKLASELKCLVQTRPGPQAKWPRRRAIRGGRSAPDGQTSSDSAVQRLLERDAEFPGRGM